MNCYTERPINGHPHGSAAFQISNYVFKHHQTFVRSSGKGFVV